VGLILSGHQVEIGRPARQDVPGGSPAPAGHIQVYRLSHQGPGQRDGAVPRLPHTADGARPDV
jgi:hypothetical protein